MTTFFYNESKLSDFNRGIEVTFLFEEEWLFLVNYGYIDTMACDVLWKRGNEISVKLNSTERV